MKLLQLSATLLSLTSLSASTAFPKPDATTISLALPKREVTNGAYCLVNDVEWVTGFQITTWGDDDWGQAFIDNINSQCWVDHGYAKNWYFYYEEGPPLTNGHAGFEFTGGWTWGADCVQNAIWLASEATGAIWGVECQVGSGF